VDALADFLELDALDRESGAMADVCLDGLFTQQRDAVDDAERFKAYLCPRRSGKSHTDAVELFATSEAWPNEESLAVSITRGHCQATIGSALERLKRQYDLPLKSKHLEGRLYYHNERTNHRIWLSGCKDFNEADKLRGDYLVHALVDEAQAIPLTPHPASLIDSVGSEEKKQPKLLLQYLVEDVLSPRLIDKNGSLTLTGTTGQLLKCYFWEVTTGEGARKKWKTHHWSMRDNIHLPNVEAQIKELCEKFGWDPSSPSFQREILGRWVSDPNALIYKYTGARNAWHGGAWPGCLDELIHEFGTDLYWALGVDLGHWDATTFVLGAYVRGTSKWIIPRAWGGSEMTQPQRSQAINDAKRELERRGQHLACTVLDTGGGGKMIAHDLTQTFGVPVEAAQKVNKAAGIRLVQADIGTGSLLINPQECGGLLGEWSVLPWNREHTGHDERYADHFADGCLYLRRQLPIRHRFEAPVPTPQDIEAAQQRRIASIKGSMARISGLKQQLARARSLSDRHRIQQQIRQLQGKINPAS
jgi:hypothetical protein